MESVASICIYRKYCTHILYLTPLLGIVGEWSWRTKTRLPVREVYDLALPSCLGWTVTGDDPAGRTVHVLKEEAADKPALTGLAYLQTGTTIWAVGVGVLPPADERPSLQRVVLDQLG
jgi:hypothetical protein